MSPKIAFRDKTTRPKGDDQVNNLIDLIASAAVAKK
jgi:hypothetical protein